MITRRHLQYFVATAERGGTSAAARVMNLSQPTVSIAIRELEEMLGAQLFIRNPPKGLVVTSFGQRKLAHARRLLSCLDNFELGEGSSIGPGGRVSLGYFTTLGPSFIPALLAEAAEKFPDIEIELVEGDLEELYLLLERGQIELALTYDVGLCGRVEKHCMQELAPYALLPHRHVLGNQENVSLTDLVEYPFILIDLPHSRDFILSAFWHHDLEPNIQYKTRSLEMVRGMVANGLGVSMLYTRPDKDYSYDGKAVTCRPIQHKTALQKLILAHSSDTELAEPAIIIADYIKNWFGKTTS